MDTFRRNFEVYLLIFSAQLMDLTTCSVVIKRGQAELFMLVCNFLGPQTGL